MSRGSSRTSSSTRSGFPPTGGPPESPSLAGLLYGAGLRVLECCRLRIRDVDFFTNQIVVRGGKGDKDRVTMLPDVTKADLARHLVAVRRQHADDLTAGAGWVELPTTLHPKYPHSVPRVGLAMGLPRHAALRRPRDWPAAAAPPPRDGPPAGHQRSRNQ